MWVVGLIPIGCSFLAHCIAFLDTFCWHIDELRSSYLPFVCFEYLMIFWMFYHINWFKKISTNRTWIVDCSRSFPPDSRCSWMPMSPMAMCQLLCGAGDGFNIPTLRSLLVPLRSQKTLACEIFIFFIYFCTYISGDFFIVCFKSISFQEQQNWDSPDSPPKNHPKLWKTTVTLSRECISRLRQLFGWGLDGCGLQRDRYLWPSPKNHGGFKDSFM